MIPFKKIVKNYRQVYKLGNEIINHRKLINELPSELRYEEYMKQEERIERFF